MTAPANYEISEFSATLLLELKIISNHHTERERSDLFLFFLYLSPLPPILQCCQLFSLERRVPCPSQLAESAIMTGWQTASRRTQKEKCHFINPAWPCHQAATSPTSALPQQPSKRVIPLHTRFFFFCTKFPFPQIYLNGWWAISQESNREEGEGERNTISNDSSTWFFIISWRHVLLWIIAWLWPLMGSLRTHNSSKIFIVGSSRLRMHTATQIWCASSAFNKTCQTAQNVQDLLTDWPFNKKLKPVSMKLKWQLEWYN